MDWGFIGVILAVILFGSTTVLAIKLAKRKKPVWAYTTEKIIGLGTSAPSDLKLFFRKKPVTNVYRTTVIVFNKGETAIQERDVTKTITVSFIGATILGRPIIKPSSDEFKPVAKRISRGHDSAVELYFPYLDHNDGAIIEVLHTKYDDIECTGNILEAGSPRYIGTFTPHHSEGFYVSLVTAIVFTGMLTWMWLDTFLGDAETTIDWFMVTFLALFTIVDIFFLIYGVIRGLLRYMRFPRWSRAKKAEK